MEERGRGERGGRRGVARYVEACLLLLLAQGPAHGWELSERLADLFPLPDRLPDISTVYRALAELEAQGAVAAVHAAGDGGGRKVYTLTDVGSDLLGFWEDQFRAEHSGLTRLLRHFKRSPGRT